MSAPTNPTATQVTFAFSIATAYQTSGHDRFDLYARAQLLPARGYAIHTNGMDPNCKVDPDNGITDLIPRAPRDELLPMITFAPSSQGKIFGTGFKWRYRYSNSSTGETSGMSPVPSVGLTLGQTTSGTSFLGQTAYFKIPGVATTYGMDTIELLRNTSAQDDVWYVIDKASNPGAASYVSFTDNNPDEDIWNNEQGSLRVNPTYYEPHPPPCVRSYQHPTGRVCLYGHIPMGTYAAGYASGGASVTTGNNLVSGTNTKWYRGREGQMLRFLTDSDRSAFRIVEVTDLNALYATPAAPANLSGQYEIVDDIDSRDIYMMQPLSPCQYDTRDVLRVGQDRSDGVKGMEGLDGTTYVLTRHNFWALRDDISENPRDTYRVEKIASVGCVGFFAWCKTPFGIVFVDETQGVMLFDGSGPPRPLGSDSPLVDFKPLTQFLDFDKGLMEDVCAEWDPIAKRVFVTYCPTGVASQTKQISFDPSAAPGGNWRGPWRRPLYRGGLLRNATGGHVFLTGDQFGGLYLDGDIAQDQIATVVSGTIASVDNPVQITATGGVITNAMVGAPILFNDLAGNYYLNWIARRISATKAVLLLVPSTTLAAGWTFQIGAIHWKARTAYLDLGEPMRPKKLTHVGMRWEPMATNVDDVVVQATSEGVTVTESADAAADRQTVGLVKGDAAVNAGGTNFQLRFSGRASYGGPRITGVALNVTVAEGTSHATSGDNKKKIMRPTAS